MKELSKITELFTESVIREMTRVCDEHGGINLSQGFPDFESSKEIKEAAIKAIRDGWNQYPVTFGEPELREAIAKKAIDYNEMDYNPKSEITVTCGATEAMIATLKAILNHGDEIIIFEPYYENYGPDGILCGAIPKYVSLNYPDWSFEKDELRKAFNSKTKAIIINTPNNPTGKVFTKEELSFIADLCQEWDAYAVTDEIYEHILYDDQKHISLASLKGMRDRTITINSLSKTYSVTGWRVGWAIASEEITSRIRKVHDFLTVGAPTPFQHAGVVALGFKKEYYSSLMTFYNKARKALYESLLNVGFLATLPQGAYYIISDTNKVQNYFGTKNDVDFSLELIKKCHVATVPGSSFFSDPKKGSNFVRFTFCKKLETLEMAKTKLQKGIPFQRNTFEKTL